jgi:hypothetical protein
MNVTEVTGTQGQEPLVHYVATTLALMCATTWLVIACQSRGPFHAENSTLMERAGWPMFFLLRKSKEKWGKGPVRDIEMTKRG